MNVRLLVSPLSIAMAGAALFLVVGACGSEDDAAGPGPGGNGSTSSSEGSGASTADGGSDSGGNGGTGAGSGDTCLEDPSLCGGDRPVCALDGSCVECTPLDRSACTGNDLTCDELTNTCGPCRFHEQCPGAACNVFTGLCMTATPVTVGPDAGDDFGRIDLAVDAIPTGGEGVILVKDKSTPYNRGIDVGNRTIAILAANPATERPRVDVTQLAIDTNAFTVLSGGTLMVEGLGASSGRFGFEAQSGNLALDRVDIRGGRASAIIADGNAEVRLRNTIIADHESLGGSPVPGITFGPDVVLDINFSSIATPSSFSPAIQCEVGGNSTVTIRNSILFAGVSGANPALQDCIGVPLMVENTIASEMIPGMGNATFVPSSGLFEDLAGGDLRLTTAGRNQFADQARWTDFDPRVDIDARPRPNLVDGGLDVAGAHLGP